LLSFIMTKSEDVALNSFRFLLTPDLGDEKLIERILDTTRDKVTRMCSQSANL